ncbi:MAG: cation:proton antiporter [Rubricoccaceae bacterium]
MDLPVPDLPVTDPVLIMAITMGILLIGPLLFERMRIPGLVGLIALGAVAGPSMTGLLERDATFILLGTFGLLYLMFIAGLTLDLAEFAKERTRAVAFGLLSFGAPMALAIGVGTMVLGYSLPAAALLGSIVGSHTLLAVPLARKLGIAKNRALVIATGATLVTDLLSLIVLAVVQGIVGGDAGPEFWIKMVVLDAIWGVGVLLVLPRVAQAFFRRVRREDNAAFAFLLSAVFLAAWTSGLVGLAPIIGAFLAGIALNRLVPKQSPLMTRLQFVGDAIFIPFFLVSVGLLVDVTVLGSLRVWALALTFSALVFVGKSTAAFLGIPFFRFTRDEATTVAGLTFPQAAATLAVTLIGFDIGLFSQEAVNAVVLVIVITCLVGPSLVRAFGRKVALAEAERPFEPSEAPERILVTLGNPETSEELMELALLLRSPTSEQAIYPLTVARGGAEEGGNVAEAEKMMERAILHVTAADVPVSPTVRIDVNPTLGIVRGAREVRASEIIAGWTGTFEPGALVFGGVLDGVLEHSRSMVVVARLVAPLATAKRLVVLIPPLIYREAGFARAIRVLKNMAAQTGMQIIVFGLDDEVDLLAGRIEAAKPSASVEVRPLSTWRDMMPALDGAIQPTDVLVLFSVRTGAVAWRPALQRLPRVLARRFSDNDLMTLHLSEVEVGSFVAEAVDGDGTDDLHLPEANIALDLVPGEPLSLLRRLLTNRFPDAPSIASSVAQEVVATAIEGAPEVMPGVVFYHAHTDAVEQPETFVGVIPQGAPLPQASGPVSVLLLLLAPPQLDPEVYLRYLAVTAQLVRQPETVEALLETTSAEEAQQLLFDGLRQGASAAGADPEDITKADAPQDDERPSES